MSVVIDTNVFVAAIKNPEGVCATVYNTEAQIFITKEIIDEVTRTLAHPRLHISQTQQEEFMQLLLKRTKLINSVEVITDCRDPDDNKFLECALAANAEVIITGDKDLLVMHPWRGIDILAPRVFLELHIRK